MFKVQSLSAKILETHGLANQASPKLLIKPRSVNKKLIYAAISYSISTGKKYSCTI